MSSDTSYWELVEELWTAEPDFILMEQDVVPTEAVVRNMWGCTAEWCSGTAEFHDFDSFGLKRVRSGHLELGLVKFGSIRHRFPDIMARLEELSPARHWGQVVGLFWSLLENTAEAVGESKVAPPHLHFPPVIHLTDHPNYEAWKAWRDKPLLANHYGPRVPFEFLWVDEDGVVSTHPSTVEARKEMGQS